jgi:Mg2+ and Co2+ transporter CorA
VISSLYTEFSALVLELDKRLDTLEQRVLHEAGDEELSEITAIRYRAAVIRRTVIPGRDLAARTPSGRSAWACLNDPVCLMSQPGRVPSRKVQ